MTMQYDQASIRMFIEAADSEPQQANPPAVVLPSPEEIRAQELAACTGIAEHFPWVGPLIEAAMLCPAEERRPVEVSSCWGGDPRIVSPADANPDKHAAYTDHILRVMHGMYPWLLSLLDAAKATLLLSPGVCCFTVHTRIGAAFDIPQLIPLTHLTPFVPEAGDPIH